MSTLHRILIAEDESLIALDLSRRLPKLGYEVVGTVATGEQAIQHACRLKPDLILMDICLKGPIDGIQAAISIREQLDVPVVFLTANSDEKTLLRAKGAYPSSYLLKPFKERELQIGVEMALLNHGLQTRLNEALGQLEERVTERTQELAQTNEALRTEIETRKKMETQAREQADLLDKARDAIFARDLAGKITYWNNSAERLYGYPEGEAVGSASATLVDESSAADNQLAEHETLRAGDWTGELRHRTKGGATLTVESRWSLVRDEHGVPQKILVVNTDITERKKIAEQLMRTQRLESVGALASGITHDLNNVFSPILMASDLMVGASEPQRERIMGMVRNSARRGADMVKQLLVFVRGGTQEKEPVDVARLVEEVRALMEDTLPRSISVTARIGPDVQLVLADVTQLHQVLVNLCINARDAMPDGGYLVIQLENVIVPDGVAWTKAKPGSYMRLTVSDTGTGMPPEIVEKIFAPFFTTKEVGKGTGLGLSTVTNIVRDHDGVIEVQSEVGKGTQFLVYLPVIDSMGIQAEANAPRLIEGRGELIVVAEDDQFLREFIKMALEAHNYRVLVAEDGAEALTLYIQQCDEVALVITDIMMPVMNGSALIHALRKFRRDLPIIAFTATEKANSLTGTLEEKSVAILRKPATSEQLLLAISQALHPAKPAAVLAAEPSR